MTMGANLKWPCAAALLLDLEPQPEIVHIWTKHGDEHRHAAGSMHEGSRWAVARTSSAVVYMGRNTLGLGVSRSVNRWACSHQDCRSEDGERFRSGNEWSQGQAWQ